MPLSSLKTKPLFGVTPTDNQENILKSHASAPAASSLPMGDAVAFAKKAVLTESAASAANTSPPRQRVPLSDRTNTTAASGATAVSLSQKIKAAAIAGSNAAISGSTQRVTRSKTGALPSAATAPLSGTRSEALKPVATYSVSSKPSHGSLQYEALQPVQPKGVLLSREGILASTPTTTPEHHVRVTKWVDYTNKYGLAYQLSDETIGVVFNDTSKMILAPDGS